MLDDSIQSSSEKSGFLRAGSSGARSWNFVYLSEKNPKVLEIKPGIYHGYKAIEPGSILMYYLTEKYNPDDEKRAPVGYFNEEWAAENK